MIQVALFDMDGLFLGTITLEQTKFESLVDNIGKFVDLQLEDSIDIHPYKVVKLLHSIILIQIPEKQDYDKNIKYN